MADTTHGKARYLSEEVPSPDSSLPSTQTDNGAAAAAASDTSGRRTIRGFRWFLVCVGCYSANFLFGLDTTVVADVQGAVSDSLQNVTQLGWLGVGFTLGVTVAVLPLGKAYGVFDNKWVFIGCLVNFGAANALAGAAPNMNAMIVARVWAGIGGAGMYLGTLNLPTLMSEPHEHGFYVGLTGFVYGSGCILGPVFGGLLSDSSATWRWAFYLIVLVFAAISPIHLFLVPSLPRAHSSLSWTNKLKKLDWLGMVLIAGLYTSLIMAFSAGGATLPWNDGGVIAPFVVSGVLIIAFSLQQHYAVLTNKSDRLFPCDLLANPQLIILYILNSCAGGTCLFLNIYYIPLYFLFAKGDTGTAAAVRLLPFICVYVAGVLLCGAVMGRTGYHIIWFLFCGLCLIAGGVSMYTVNTETKLANIVGYTILLGAGMATSQAPYSVGTLLVPPHRRSDVIQLLNIAQGQAQLLALTIASAIFQTDAFSGMKRVLAGRGYSDGQIRGALTGLRSQLLDSLPPDVRAACIDVIVNTISHIWVMVIAAGCLWTASTLFLTRSRWVSAEHAQMREKVKDTGQA